MKNALPITTKSTGANPTGGTASTAVARSISRIQHFALGLLAVMLAATTLMSFAAPASATERSRSVERTRVEQVERVEAVKVLTLGQTGHGDVDSFTTDVLDGGGILCPAGFTATAWDKPIYDDETGLWVVGYETVWFCHDDSLEPEG